MPTDDRLLFELKPHLTVTKNIDGKDFEYLSNEKLNEYLTKKGFCKVINGDLVVLQDNLGRVPYFHWRDRIQILLKGQKYVKAGTMGVDINELEKDVNKINKEQIERIKENVENTITADEVDF